MSALVLLALACLAQSGEIKHRFLATDGETSKLIYVDQAHPENDWTVETPKGPRDIRILPENETRVLVSHRAGIVQYELKTGKQMGIVNGYKDVQSAIPLSTGGAFFAGMTDKGITLFKVDLLGSETSRVVVEGRHSVRNIQLLENGHVLMTCGDASKKSAIEVDASGKVVWEVSLPGPADDIDRIENGLTVVPTGPLGTAIYLDKEGKVVATRGGKDAHPDLKINWFASTQTLKNGNLVVTNWLGHKAGKTGPDALEFDPANKVVWKWESEGRVQTLHNILVLE